jgi:hypothetical protein
MSKSRPIVRGPQKALPFKRTPILRQRFLEPPAKQAGNPFVAVRVPREVHSAFMRKCKARKVTPAGVVRALIAKWSGVKLGVADGE